MTPEILARSPSDAGEGPGIPPIRRFTLGDGMIVVAGAAVGFALIRHEQIRIPATRVGTVFLYGSGLCIGLSLAHLVIRVRRPRPPWRVVASQLGMSASLIVPVMLVIDTAFLMASGLFIPSVLQQLLPLDDLAVLIGTGVLGSWISQIASRSVERRGDWVEWAGRSLGLIWIGLFGIFLWAYYA